MRSPHASTLAARIRRSVFGRLVIGVSVTTVFAGQTILGATYTWNQTATGTTYSWATSSNWTPSGIPNATGDVANLNNDIAGNQTVNLNQTVTLGALNIGDTSGTSTFTLAGGTGGYLILDAASGSATISKATGGNDTISTGLQFNDALSVTNNSAGSLTLSGTLRSLNSNIVLDGTGAITVSGVIATGGNLQKNGGGTTTLSGASTYAGTTTVNTGTLALSNAAALPARSAVTVVTGASLDYLNTATAIGSLAGAGDVKASTASAARILTIGRDETSTTFSGRFVGPTNAAFMAITKIGAGTLTLAPTAASTYTGATVINGGTLALDFSAGTLSSILASTSLLTIAGGDLKLKGRSGASVDQSLSSTGAFTLGASGGSIIMESNGGTLTRLNLGTITSTAAGGSLLVNAPTNTAVRFNHNLNGGTNLNGRIVFTDGSGAYNWAANGGATTDTVGLATYADVAGTSIATVTDTNNSRIDSTTASQTTTVSGTWITNSLKINAGATGQTLALGANSLTLTNGGLLFTGANDYSITSSTGTLKSGTATNSDLIIHQYGSGNLTIGAVLANGIGTSTLTKTGSGKLTLTGANSFTGGVFVNGGILSFSDVASGAGGLGSGVASAITIRDGATLQYTGATGTIAAGTTAGSHTFSLSGGNARIEVTNAATVLTLAGGTSGGGSLVKIGAGTLAITGSATYTGSTYINEGTLQITAADLLPTTPMIIASGAFLDIAAGSDTIGSISGAGTITAGAATSARTLTVGGDNLSSTFSGTFTGTGAGHVLTKTGTGALTLTGTTSQWTGGTNVNGGVLRWGANSVISSTGTMVVANAAGPAALDLGDFNQTLAALTIYGSSSTATSQGNIILNNGVLTIAGTVTVNNNNNPLASYITSTGTGGIAMTAVRTVDVRDSTAVAAADAELTISANISGTGGGITKAGGGNLRINGGTNTSTGTNTFNSGITWLDYTIANTAKLGTGALAIAGGTVILEGNASASTAQSVASFTLSAGNGVLTLNEGAGQSLVLNLGAITRAAGTGGVIRFNLPGGAQTSTNGITTTTQNDAATGLLGIGGGFATVTDASGVTQFATNVGGNIVGITPTTQDNVAGWVAGSHISDSAGFTGTTAYAPSIRSLRFNATAGGTVTIPDGGTLTISSGGVLQTNNVTGGTANITGGTLRSGTGNELIFINDSLTQNLQVGSTLTGAAIITKAGNGTLRLTNNARYANDHTGGINLYGGTLQVSGGYALGDRATLTISALKSSVFELLSSETVGTLATGGQSQANITTEIRLNGNTLTFNQEAAGTYSGLITSTAGGALVKSGSATWTFAQASPNFLGTFQINQGQVTFSGNVAQLSAAAAVILNGPTSVLQLNNDQTTAVASRINDAAMVTLNNTAGGLGLSMSRTAGTTTGTESVSRLVLGAGHNTLAVDGTGANRVGRLSFTDATSLSRTNLATLLVLGRALGDTTATQRGSILFTSDPGGSAGGGGAAGTTTTSIYPYMVGESTSGTPTATNYGNSFVLFGGTNTEGVRPLNLTTEYVVDQSGATGYDTLLGVGIVTNNVRFTTTTTTLASDTTGINSLVLDSGTGVIVTGPSQAYTISSGAILSAGAGANEIKGFTGIATAGSRPYYLYVTNPSGTLTMTSPLVTAQDLVKSGAGTLILASAANAFTNLYLNQGVVQADALNKLGSGNLNFFSGTLKFAGVFDPSSKTMLFGTGGAVIDTNSNNITFANAVGGSGSGSFTKIGGGTLTFQASATYTGATAVNDGKLIANGGGSNRFSTSDLTLGSGTTSGIVQLGDAVNGEANQTVSSLSTSGTGTANAIVGGGASASMLTVNQNTTTTFAGNLGGTGTNENSLGLTKGGIGALTLSGATISYTGATVVNGGTLNITGSTAAPLATSSIFVAGGATFNFLNSAGQTINLGSGVLELGSGSGTTVLGLELGSTSAYDSIRSNVAATTSNTILFNLTGLSGFGAGSYDLLTAASGLSGGAYVLGTLSGQLTGVTLNLTSSDTFVRLNATAAAGNFYWRGGINASWMGNAGLMTNFTTDVAGITNAQGTPGVASTVIFSAQNVTGPSISTTLDANFAVNDLKFTSAPSGVTSVLIAPGSPSTSSLTIAPSSSLVGIDVADNAGAITISAPVVLGADQTWSVAGTGANGSSLTVSGAITGSGALNISSVGSGVVTLSGANTYNGATNVNSGVLRAGSATGFSANSTYTISSGATLRLNAFNNSIGALSGAGIVENGGTTNISLTAGANNASTTFSGTLQNGGANTLSFIKSGTGTLTLTGAANHTGTTTVSGGVLVAAGTSTATGNITVGNTASVNAVLNVVSGGTLTGGTLTVGTATGSFGAVNVTGGTLTMATPETTDTISFGAANGGYGAFTISSGTFTQPRFMFGGTSGTSGAGGIGVGLVSGGTVNTNGYIILARLGASAGILTITGGSINHTGASQNINLGWQGSGRAEFNVAGGLVDNTGKTVVFGGSSWTGTGILNLNAGTLLTNGVTESSGTSILNFNGGTLKAAASSTTFVASTIDNIYVNGAFGAFAGGAVIDSNGFDVTVAKGMSAPTGSGVSSLSVGAAGSGYIGAPQVEITGGGGTGATGYAVVDTDPNSATFGQVTNVVLTNPGVGYTSTPTVNLLGGGGSGASVSAAGTVANTSGGLTKVGDGALTLSGVNTYTGATTVNGGRLSITPDALPNTSLLTVGATGNAGFDLYADGVAAAWNAPSGTSIVLGSASTYGTLGFNLGTTGDSIVLSGGGALTINAGGGFINGTAISGFGAGSYVVLSGASSITGASNLKLGTLPAGYQYSLNVGADSVTLNVLGFAPAGDLYWTGAANTSWSGLSGSNSNWATVANGATDAGYAPGANNLVYFSATNASTSAINTTLDSAISIQGLRVINSGTGPVTIAPGLAGTLTLGASGIEVQSGAPTLTTISAPVVLGAAQSWFVTTGNTLSVSGVVSGGVATGNTALTVNGGGIVNLSGVNTFTGNVIIEGAGSTLAAAVSQLSGADANSPLGAAGAHTYTIQNGGVFSLTSANTINPTSASGKAFVIAAGMGTIDVANVNGLIQLDDAGQFTLAANANLAKTGAGVLLLGANYDTTVGAGAAAYVYGGTLRLQNTGALGATNKAPINLQGGNLDLRLNSGGTFGNAVIVGADATISTGRTTAAATNITQTMGTLSIGSYVLTSSNGTGNTAPGVANLTFGATTFTGSPTFNVTNVNGTGVGTLTLGAISDGGLGYGLTKTGAGILLLNGINTYGGVTNVSAGTLQLSKALGLYFNNPAQWTDANIIVNTGATLALNIGGSGEFSADNLKKLLSLGTATGGFMDNSTIQLDTTNAAGGNFVYDQAITDTNGSANKINLVKAGSGTLTLTSSNTYTGLTTISGGALAGSISARNLILNGGVYGTNGTFTRSLGSGDGQVRWVAGANGGFSAEGGALTVTLAAAPNPLVWDSTPDFVSGAGQLLFGSTTSDNVVTFTHNLNLNDPGSAVTRTVQVLDNTSSTSDKTVFSGTLSGGANATLAKTGAGVLELTGANTYSGPTTNTTGTLILSGSNNSAGTTTLTSGTLQLNSSSNGGLASGLLTLTAGTLQALSADRTISNNVLMTAVTVAGSQSLTVNGTLTGATGGSRTLTNNLSSGTLTLGAVAINNDSTAARSLTIAGTGNNNLNGVISNGNGDAFANLLSITSTGTTTISGANTYTGATTITAGAGTVIITNNQAFGLGTALTLASGTLQGDGTGTKTLSQNVTHTTGTVTLGGTDKFVFNGSWTVSGGTRTLTVNSTAGADLTGNLILGETTNNRAQGFAGTGTITVSGIIQNNSGAAAPAVNTLQLQYTGSGILNLTGANSYGGQTTINGPGGTVNLTGSGRLGSGILVVNAGTLNLNSLLSQTVNALTMGGGAAGSSSTIAVPTGSSLIIGTGAAINYSATNNPLTAVISGSGTLDLGTAGITVDVGNSTAVDVDMSWQMNTVIGSGLFIKNGAGTLDIRGVTNYNYAATGYQINAGAVLGLDLYNNNLILNGGVYEGNGTFTRSLGTGNNQVQWLGSGGGGFSARGGSLSVTLSSAPSPLVWGSTQYFVPDGAPLIFGSTTADNVVTFNHDIDLNGATRTINAVDNALVTTDWATLPGVLSNGGITKTGNGVLRLTGANTFTGPVTVTLGTLEFTTVSDNGGAASNLGQGTNGLSLGGGTLSFVGSTSQSTNRAMSFTASSTLSANGTSGATITYTGAIDAGTTASAVVLTGTGGGLISGGITQSGTSADVDVNSGTWTLSGALSTLSDDLRVTGAGSVLNLGTTGSITFISGTSNFIYARNGGVVKFQANNVTSDVLGLEGLLAGFETAGAVGVIDTNGFNITTPRLDLGNNGTGLVGSIIGAGTITVTTDYNLYAGTISANLAGAGNIEKLNIADVTLSGDNSGLTVSGSATLVNAGRLILDYSTSNATKLSTQNTLDMRGGTLKLQGGVLAATVQDVLGFTLASGGANVVDVSSTGLFSTTLNLGAITRANSAGVVLFTLGTSGAITTTTTNNATTGLLGTTGTAFATVKNSSGTFFAINDGAGNIAPLTYATFKNDVSTWAAGDHVSNSAAFTGTVDVSNINSLRFNASAASAVNVGTLGVLTIGSGGILQTENVTTGSTAINGGRLVSGTGELVVTTDSATSLFTISSYLSGTTALTKSGAGTLLLNGTNHYSGATNIHNGTLQVSGGNAIGDRSVVTLADDHDNLLELLDDETIGALAGGSATTGLSTLAVVDVGSHTLTLNQIATSTYSGVISGSGQFIKSGASTLSLGGVSDFTGDLIVNQGQLTLATRTVANLSTVGTVTLNAGTLLLDFASGNETNPNKINNNAPVTLINTGGLDGLRGNNDRNDASKAETVGALTLLGGANTVTLQANATVSTTARQMTITVASITRSNRSTLLVRGNNLGDLAANGIVNSGRFVSTALPALSGGTGAAGTTTIGIVPWAIGSSTATASTTHGLGNSFVTAVATTGFRPLDLTTEYEQLVAAGGVTLTNNVRYSAAADLTLDSSTARTMNALLVDNTSTTAAISLNGAGGTLNVASGAFLFTGSATPQGITLGGFSGITTGSGNEYIFHVVNAATAGVTVSSPFTTTAAALTKSGAGTLILTGTGSTYTGPTTINQGILQIDSLNKLGNFGSGGIVFNGGTLRMGAAFDLSAVPISFGVADTSTVDVTAGGTIDTNGFSPTFSTTIGGGGNGGFTKAGTGVLTLNAAANYGGATTISAGSVVYGVANALPSTTDLSMANTTAITFGSNAATFRALTITGTATFTGSAPLVFNGNFTNSGGDRTLTLNNSSPTTFNGDYLFLSESASARTFTMSVTGTGLVTVNSDIVDGGAAASNFSKSGSGTTELKGANVYGGTTTNATGTLIFSGSNTGGGGTTLTSGTIQLNSAANGGIASGTLTLTAGTVQALNAARTLSNATLLGGTVTVSGSQSLTLNGSLTNNAGSRTLNSSISSGGTLTLAGPVYLSEAVATGRTLTLGGTGDTMITGIIANANGTGSVASNFVSGSTGLTTLAASNTYTGSTSVNDGILRFTAVQNMTGSLQFGSAATTSTAGKLEVKENATFTSMTVQTNSSTNTSRLEVDSGKVLTINGNVVIGSGNTSLTNTLFNATGGGSWAVNNTASGSTFRVGGSAANGNVTIADFTGLQNLTVSLNTTDGVFRVGSTSGTNVASTYSTLTLGVNTTITAATLSVGDGGQNNGSVGQINSLYLGTGTNVLNVNTLNIGTTNRDLGRVAFAGSSGTITINNTAGTGRTAFNLGTGQGTGVTAAETNTFDVRGHTANLLLGIVAIGTSNRGASYENVFSFDQGSLDMTSLSMSTRSAESTNGALLARDTTSTLNIGGGSVAIQNGITAMATAAGAYGTNPAPKMTALINISGNASVNIGATSGTSISMGNYTATAGTGTGAAVATLNLTGTSVTTVQGNIIKGGTSALINATINLSGGTLDMSNKSIGATGTGVINFNAESGVLMNLAQLNGGAGLSKTTTGTLILENSGVFTNTYTGGTSIVEGILQVGSGSTTGTLGGGTVSNSATLKINRSNAYTITNTITGAGAFIQEGTGTTTLSGSNDYTGETTINNGTLEVGSTGALGTTGNIRFGGGTLQYTASNTTDYSSRIKNSTSAIKINTNNQTVTFSGSLASSNTGGLAKEGAGTLKLASDNVYSGATSINSGNLVAASTHALSSGDVLVGVGGTLTIGDSGILQQVEIGGSFTSTGTLAFDIFSRSAGTNPTTSNDFINLTSTDNTDVIDLTGTLEVKTTLDSTTWQKGDEWTLLDWSLFLGTKMAATPTYTGFGSLDQLPTLAGGLEWNVFVTNTSLGIRVVPEPSRVLFLMLGFGALFLRRRRR